MSIILIYLYSCLSEKAIALNIDLVPTFLDIAGAHRPDYIDGSSLLSVLSAKKKQR